MISHTGLLQRRVEIVELLAAETQLNRDIIWDLTDLHRVLEGLRDH